MSSASLAIIIVTLSVATLLPWGIFLSAKAAKIPQARSIAAGIGAGLFLWLVSIAGLAKMGLFEFTPGKIPLEPLLPVSLLITLVLLSTTSSFRKTLDATPLWQPVALQTFRIGVEAAFWLLFRTGLAPMQVTFEGRNLDILVGLTAPIIAIMIARRMLEPRGVIAWNALGIALLLNAIFTVATSAPGPQHLNWPGKPFTAFGRWPVIWIPSLLAPIGMFLHVVSIRQCLRVLAIERTDQSSVQTHRVARGHCSAETTAAEGSSHVN